MDLPRTVVAKSAPLLVPIEDAAERLNISRRKLYDFLADGSLPSVALGRRRMIRLRDLEAFVEQLAPVG